MTDYTTLRVTAEAKAAAEASKRDEETWNDYIRRCTENPPEQREFVAADALDVQINYDDVRTACETALRKTLTEEVQQR